MRLHDYFMDYPKIIGNYTFKKIGIVTEIEIRDLWRELSSIEDFEVSIDKTIELIDKIGYLSILDFKEKEYTFEELVVHVKAYVIDSIASVLSDKEVEGYFTGLSVNSSNEEQPGYIGYSDLISFCIFNFGNKALQELSMNELYILRRFKTIEEAQGRIKYLNDNALSVNIGYDKQNNFSKHIRDLSYFSKTYNLETVEVIDDGFEPIDYNKTKGLSNEEIDKLASIELEGKLQGKENGKSL